MKILQINKYYSPDIGGVETVVKQYAEYFHNNNNNEVTVLCICKNLTKKTITEYVENIKIIRCSSLGTFLSMPLSFSFFYYFLRIKNNFDIVHFHEPFPLGSILSLFPKKNKYIITWHSDIIKQKIFKFIAEAFQKRLCKKADVIFTTSPNLANSSNILPKYNDKVQILPLSIDTNSLKNIKDSQETISEKSDSKNKKHEINDYQNTSDAANSNQHSATINQQLTAHDSRLTTNNQQLATNHYFLYLGRLSYYKGIDILLDAYSKIRTKINLVIAGDGEKEIIDKIYTYSKNDDRIIFINRFVSEEEKYGLISNCSFFVFPSIYPSEAFGIIQLEAMYFNKPVINTYLNTGVPWVSFNNETGLTVEPENTQQLKNAIETLAANKSLCKDFGRNAKKRVEEMFSDSVVLPKLEAFYNKILTTHHH